MARSLPPKEVQCYHCDHRFEVGGRAQSTSCPGCNKPVIVADQEIKGQRGPIRELKTCGQVIIKKRGRLICQHIVAHNGLTCEGIIDAKTVQSRMPVTLGPKSTFKGDLTAPALTLGLGAKIQRSQFAIGPPHPPRKRRPRKRPLRKCLPWKRPRQARHEAVPGAGCQRCRSNLKPGLRLCEGPDGFARGIRAFAEPQTRLGLECLS